MQTNKEILKALGQRVRVLREQRNISLNIFAFENDLSKATLSKIENGLADPRLSTLIKISKSLEIPLEELIKF